MNISRTERRIAGQLRIEIKPGLVLVIQEGDTNEDHLWFSVFVKEQGQVTSVNFSLERNEMRQLGEILTDFAVGRIQGI